MKKLLYLSCLILFFSACKKDDDPAKSTNDPIMEVEKDGESFTVTQFNNTLLVDNQGGETGRRLDLRGEVDGGTLFITVSNWDWQNPPENGILVKNYHTNEDFDQGPDTQCMDDGTFTYCDGGLGTYQISNTEILFSEDLEDESFGSITITENDPEAKTVSGSFDFIVTDLFNENIITFKGTFSNLNY